MVSSNTSLLTGKMNKDQAMIIAQYQNMNGCGERATDASKTSLVE